MFIAIIPSLLITSGWLLISCGLSTILSLYFSKFLKNSSILSQEIVKDVPDAHLTFPASIRSKIEFCKTSEYTVKSSKSESFKHSKTAFETLPTPA